MARSEATVREKILLATVECIEREGVHSLTIRGIAKVAGVNIAAINYYFSSKEKLLSEALEYTLNNVRTDIRHFMDLPGITPKARLRAVLIYLLEGGFKYPGITKAHLYDPIVHNEYNGEFIPLIKLLCDELLLQFTRIDTDSSDRERLQIALAQILSAVMLPVLMPGLFQRTLGLVLRDPVHQQEYVEQILDRYFPDET